MRNHLEILENQVQGGISSVYSNGLRAANTKCPKNFDKEKPTTLIIIIRAKNLYCEVMKKFWWPSRNFLISVRYGFKQTEPELIKKF